MTDPSQGPQPLPTVETVQAAVPPPATTDPYRPPQIETILRQLREVVAGARPMPLSASSMVNKEELLGLIDEANLRLPEELRAARWLLKERDEFLVDDAHDLLNRDHALQHLIGERPRLDRLDAGHFCGDFAGGGKLLAKALDLCKACIHHGHGHSIKPPESLAF